MSAAVMTRDFASARKAMIDSQLRTSGVNEEYILGRMAAVAREKFLPEEKASLAYIDRSVRLDENTCLASPLFYGKLLMEAAPLPDDRALVLHGGTNYLAELVEPLVHSQVSSAAIDATQGDLAHSDYSLVLIDGAIEALPSSIADMLSEGGRVVSGIVENGVTRLASGRKVAGRLVLEPVEDIGIPVLHSFDRPRGWTF